MSAFRAAGRSTSATAGLVFVACLLAACGHKELSEPPPKKGETVTPDTPESVVAGKIAITYARLAEEANKAAPEGATFAGRADPKPCVRIGPKGDLPFGGSYDLTKEVCTDADYSITITRVGPVTVAKGPAPNSARASVPITADGWAGLTGAVAEVLKLDRKNLRAAVEAWVDVSLDVDSNWCPKVTATPDFRWTDNAKIEITHNWWIDINGLAAGKLHEQLAKMGDQMVAAISCDKVRTEITKLYAPQSVPIAIPGRGEVFVNVEPLSLGFSGVQATDKALEMAFMLGAKVAMDTTAGTMNAKPLPLLTRVPLAPGKIELALPLRASYQRFNEAIAREVKGKTFSNDTSAGHVAVTVEDAEVYPSGDKVAIGVKFKAQTPSRWFDASGSVYLAGTPTVENEGRVLALTDPTFTRILDNELWNALSALFESQIRGTIAKSARVDLSEPIAQGKAALAEKLDQLKRDTGVQVQLADPKVVVERMLATADELVAQLRLQTSANVLVASSP